MGLGTNERYRDRNHGVGAWRETRQNTTYIGEEKGKRRMFVRNPLKMSHPLQNVSSGSIRLYRSELFEEPQTLEIPATVLTHPAQ